MARQIARMDELIAEPGKCFRIEVFNDPVDHAPHAGNARGVGMIGEPDIKGKNRVDIERHHFRAHDVNVGRRPADAGAFDNGPQQRRAVVGAEFDEFAERDAGKQSA